MKKLKITLIGKQKNMNKIFNKYNKNLTDEREKKNNEQLLINKDSDIVNFLRLEDIVL